MKFAIYSTTLIANWYLLPMLRKKLSLLITMQDRVSPLNYETPMIRYVPAYSESGRKIW